MGWLISASGRGPRIGRKKKHRNPTADSTMKPVA
jgi:hypothetical protein